MKSPRRALFASVLVATAGLVTAQDRPASPSAPGQEQPAVSARKPSLRQFRTETLVTFDAEKGTVTFKDDAGKSVTWPIEVRLAQYARAYAQMRLQTLKEGDRVVISYVVNPDGQPRVYDVRPAARRGAGRERPGRDGPPAETPAPPAHPR